MRKQSERLFGRDFLITLTTSKESKAHKGRVFHFKTRDSAEQDEWYDALDRILQKREVSFVSVTRLLIAINSLFPGLV